MKPTLEHPMIAHKNKRPPEAAPELKVHTVAPPGFKEGPSVPVESEDAMFARQMQQAELAFGTASPIMFNKLDSILDRELQKKETFEKLVLLKGEHTTEVTVGGLRFKMKILNSYDNDFIMPEVRKEPAEKQLNALTFLVLAAAITEVNDIRFEEFYSGPDEIVEPILRKYYEIKQYQRPVINILQKAYAEFQTLVEKDLTKDFLVK